MPAPLIFLTSTSSHVPKGLNARTTARSQSAQRSNPSKPSKGSYITFPVQQDRQSRCDTGDERASKRRRTHYCLNDANATTGSHSLHQETSQGGVSRIDRMPPTSDVVIDLGNTLQVATFHIRRRAAQIATTHEPDRTLDALRCRQWCSGSSALATCGRSIFLDHAIASVTLKVREVVSGTASQETMLGHYADALHHLRNAVGQPKRHDRADMFTATRLLAIYEMLDFPNSVSWTQHVAGALAVVRIQDSISFDTPSTTGYAVPLYVEALLSQDCTFFNSHHWTRLLKFCSVNQYPSPELTAETIACLVALRSICLDAFADGDILSRLDSIALLSRMHALRCRARALVLISEGGLRGDDEIGIGFNDIVDMLLVSVMVLDRLILVVRKHHHDQAEELEEDTQKLCNRVLRAELDSSDVGPRKNLLLTFLRQNCHHPTEKW